MLNSLVPRHANVVFFTFCQLVSSNLFFILIMVMLFYFFGQVEGIMNNHPANGDQNDQNINGGNPVENVIAAAGGTNVNFTNGEVGVGTRMAFAAGFGKVADMDC